MDTQGKSNSIKKQIKPVVSEKKGGGVEGRGSRVLFSYIPKPIHFKIANSSGAKPGCYSSLYPFSLGLLTVHLHDSGEERGATY